MNRELLKEMIEAGYVNVQKHPSEDLFIYNYSKAAQYGQIWNEVTIQCRGLIMDGNGNIVSRPFKKFFNYEQHTPDQIPNLPFTVFDKEDGCLGVLYWVSNGDPFIATRGSFTSDQSVAANDILYSNKELVEALRNIDKSKTYCFEIIHPSYRIVVDYKGRKDLILLGAIDVATGEDAEFPELPTPIVKRYDGINDYRELKKLEESNREGFIVRFDNGFRMKIKFEEYCRLHSILTNVSSKTIWRTLRGIDRQKQLLKEANDLIGRALELQWIPGKEKEAVILLEKAEKKRIDASLCPTTFAETLDNVPDEFYEWVEKKKSEIVREFDKVDLSIMDEWSKVCIDLGDPSSESFKGGMSRRREFAEYVLGSKYKYKRQIMALQDGKDLKDHIWKLVEPKFETPFINNEEG
jgi:RNA ligase